MNLNQFFTRRKIVLFVAIFAMAALFIPMAKSRVKPYRNGETINYNNHLYIGTTNTGKFELFGLEKGKLYRKATIMAQDNTKFSDLLFREENSKLFVYLVNGELNKYDITDPYFPVQVARIRDNSDNNIFGITSAGDKIATIGSQKVKIWNDNLQIINSYKINVNMPDNLLFSDNATFIYNLNGANLDILDTHTRKEILDKNIDISSLNHNQKIYSDGVDGSVYVADDSSLRKIYFDGSEKKFAHTSNTAYDVSSLPGRDYIYFSDGQGVVKLDKENLEALDWTYTTNKGAIGGWAMGLNVIPSDDGDVVIVFNGSSILALDKNLDLIDYYAARDEDFSPMEPLSLSADKYRATPNSYVSLRGAGFSPYEDLRISFSGDVFVSKTDEFGKFVRIIQVPSVFPGKTDIKVDGERSGLTYSVGFEIE